MIKADPQWSAVTINGAIAPPEGASIPVPADGTTPVTVAVQLFDTNRADPVAGRAVTLAAGVRGLGSVVVSPSSATTDATGTATFTLTDSVSENVAFVIVDATDSIELDNFQFQYQLQFVKTSNPPVTIQARSTQENDEASLSIVFTMPNIPYEQNGSITVELPSGATVPTSGLTASQVGVSVPGTGDTITGVSTSTSSTDSSVKTFTLTTSGLPYGGEQATIYISGGVTNPPRIGPAEFVVGLDGINSQTGTFLSGTYVGFETITPGHVSGTLSTGFITPHDVQIPNPAVLTVHLVDDGGNPLAGKLVFVTAQESTASVTALSSSTGIDGKATFSVSDVDAEEAFFTMTDVPDGVNLPMPAYVFFDLTAPPPVGPPPPSTSPQAAAEIVSIAPSHDGKGYWLLSAGGELMAFGDAPFFGTTSEISVSNHQAFINGAYFEQIIPTPSGNGYWLLTSDGGVFAYGDARFSGSASGLISAGARAASMAATPDGKGYWIASTGGGVFAFGDAQFFGSDGADACTAYDPVVSIAPTADGKGYRLVNVAGHTFAYGDAGAVDQSAFAEGQNNAIQGISPSADGKGYWLLSESGAVDSFGDAPFFGAPAGTPYWGMHAGDLSWSLAVTPDGMGYWVVSLNGTVLGFGDATVFGQAGVCGMSVACEL